MTRDEIEAWIRENGGGERGVVALNAACDAGEFGAVGGDAVRRYLSQVRDLDAIKRQAEERSLVERSVLAAEVQAEQAVSANRKSWIAIGISLAALALAAWPHIKEHWL